MSLFTYFISFQFIIWTSSEMNNLISQILLLCIIGITVVVSNGVVEDVTARVDQKSFLIIFDGTRSMGTDLAQLKSAAEEIINDFSKRENNQIFNYILVVFRDPGKSIDIISLQTLLLSKLLLHRS